MSEWTPCTLGDVLTLQRGFDITRANQKPGNVPVVSSSGPNSFHNEAMVAGPGVVIGRKGTLGTCFYLDGPYWPHDTTLWVKDFKGNHPKFCYYLLQGMELAKYDVGAANPTLNRNHVHLLPLAIPRPEAQRRIASILGAYDDLIEVNRRRVAVLEEMARGMFEEWFVHFRFPGYEDAPIHDRQLPEGWRWGAASELVQFDPRTPVPREGEKPFISMGHLDTSTSLIEAYELRDGNSGAKFRNDDTLFARITPCLENGKTGVVRGLPAAAGTGFGSTEFIVMRGGRAGPAFTYCLSRFPAFRQHARSSMSGASGRQRARTDSVASFEMAIPPTNRLLHKFESIAWPMLEMVGCLGESTSRLTASRDLLLSRLISGQLSVPAAERQLEDAA
jgi:type I restriction enzyme S subunit